MSRRWLGGIALLMLGAASLFFIPRERADDGDDYVVLSARGPMAPRWALVDLEGRSVQDSELRGKVLVATFWATWCAACQVELPTLDALGRAFSKDEVEVVAISVDRALEPLTEHVEREGYSFRVLWDAPSAVAGSFGVSSYPHTFVIDKQGAIVESIAGVTDWNSADKRDLIRHLISAPALVQR